MKTAGVPLRALARAALLLVLLWSLPLLLLRELPAESINVHNAFLLPQTELPTLHYTWPDDTSGAVFTLPYLFFTPQDEPFFYTGRQVGPAGLELFDGFSGDRLASLEAEPRQGRCEVDALSATAGDALRVMCFRFGPGYELFDLGTGDSFTWPLGITGVRPMALHPNGALLAFATRLRESEPYTLHLWDVVRDTISAVPLEGARAAGWPMVFSPDGCCLLYHVVRDGYVPSPVRIRDLARNQTTAELVLPLAAPLALSPGAQIIVSHYERAQVMLWSAETGRVLAAIPTDPTLLALAFSLDGRRLAALYNDGRVRQWGVK